MKIFFLLLLTLVSFNINILAQTEVETLLKNSEEFFIKNKLPEAIAKMSKAIALKPNDAFLYLRRADLNFGLPDYKSVVRDAQIKKRAVSKRRLFLF